MASVIKLEPYERLQDSLDATLTSTSLSSSEVLPDSVIPHPRTVVEEKADGVESTLFSCTGVTFALVVLASFRSITS